MRNQTGFNNLRKKEAHKNPLGLDIRIHYITFLIIKDYPWSKNLNRLCVILLFIILPSSLYPQKLVLDTLIVNFKPDSNAIQLAGGRIDTVVDERDVENSALLDYSEKNQYIFVPVDRQILADRPVAEVIRNGLKAGKKNSGQSSRLGLRHLDFSSHTRYFFRPVSLLHASVVVYNKDESIGELLYECTIPHKLSGGKIRERYRSLVEQLVRRIGSDLSEMNSGTIQSLANYRKISKQNPWMQLQTGSNMSVLTGGNFLLDVYLTFVFPETKMLRFQSPGIMRYRHMERFESIEWGLASAWMTRRYRPNWVTRFKAQLMFGLNRWNDMKTFNHKLYDAFLLDFSLGQSVHYFPKNSRSVTLGLGLVENVYYIYSTGICFDAGLMVQVGVQL